MCVSWMKVCFGERWLSLNIPILDKNKLIFRHASLTRKMKIPSVLVFLSLVSCNLYDTVWLFVETEIDYQKNKCNLRFFLSQTTANLLEATIFGSFLFHFTSFAFSVYTQDLRCD